MIRKWIYKNFAKYYIPNESNYLIETAAQILEKILGYVTFDYGGVKLAAGPYAFLDNYIVRGENINPFVTSAISQYLTSGGVFLDIGANHGVFSLLAAKNPKVKVFAFEPSPRELKRLWQNLCLNNHSNISVLSYGLGDKDGEQSFALSGAHNPGMNSLPNICDSKTIIKSNFSPLLNLLSPSILEQTKICKLDVEGQEMFILNSLRSHMGLLKKSVFVVEMNPRFLNKAGFKAEDIYQFFKEAGYSYQFGNPNNWIQWEEFFYHPDYNSELIYSENLS